MPARSLSVSLDYTFMPRSRQSLNWSCVTSQRLESLISSQAAHCPVAQPPAEFASSRHQAASIHRSDVSTG